MSSTLDTSMCTSMTSIETKKGFYLTTEFPEFGRYVDPIIPLAFAKDAKGESKAKKVVEELNEDEKKEIKEKLKEALETFEKGCLDMLEVHRNRQFFAQVLPPVYSDMGSKPDVESPEKKKSKTAAPEALYSSPSHDNRQNEASLLSSGNATPFLCSSPNISYESDDEMSNVQVVSNSESESSRSPTPDRNEDEKEEIFAEEQSSSIMESSSEDEQQLTSDSSVPEEKDGSEKKTMFILNERDKLLNKVDGFFKFVTSGSKKTYQERFEEAIDFIRQNETMTQEEKFHAFSCLSTVMDDFTDEAVRMAKDAIPDLYASDDEKKLKSRDGGAAGGEKFTRGELFLKVAAMKEENDDGSIQYKNYEKAAKVANRELLAYTTLLGLSMKKQDYPITYPLMVEVDYCGVRCLVLSKIEGIKDEETLVYGSKDGVKTNHHKLEKSVDLNTLDEHWLGISAANKESKLANCTPDEVDKIRDATVMAELEEICNALNLEPNDDPDTLKAVFNGKKSLYKNRKFPLAYDIEVHKVKDPKSTKPKYYLLDMSRLFPPLWRKSDDDEKIFLYMLMRPELTLLMNEKVQSEYRFRDKILGRADIGKKIEENTKELLRRQIDLFIDAYLKIDIDVASRNLNLLLHGFGINMYFYGYIIHEMHIRYFDRATKKIKDQFKAHYQRIVIEMVVRAIRKIINLYLREAVRQRRASELTMKVLISQVLNDLFGNEKAMNFEERVFKKASKDATLGLVTWDDVNTKIMEIFPPTVIKWFKGDEYEFEKYKHKFWKDDILSQVKVGNVVKLESFQVFLNRFSDLTGVKWYSSSWSYFYKSTSFEMKYPFSATDISSIEPRVKKSNLHHHAHAQSVNLSILMNYHSGREIPASMFDSLLASFRDAVEAQPSNAVSLRNYAFAYMYQLSNSKKLRKSVDDSITKIDPDSAKTDKAIVQQIHQLLTLAKMYEKSGVAKKDMFNYYFHGAFEDMCCNYDEAFRNYAEGRNYSNNVVMLADLLCYNHVEGLSVRFPNVDKLYEMSIERLTYKNPASGEEIKSFRHYPYMHSAIYLCNKDEFSKDDLKKAVEHIVEAMKHYSYETYKVYHNFMYFCESLFGDDESFINGLKVN